VDLSRDLWLDRLHGPRVRSLRRLAIAVIGAVAVFIAVAPYASPRAEHERGLYAVVAAVLAANALVLLVAHGWPDWILAAVAIGLPNTVVLILLATSSPTPCRSCCCGRRWRARTSAVVSRPC